MKMLKSKLSGPGAVGVVFSGGVSPARVWLCGFPPSVVELYEATSSAGFFAV